MPVFQVFSPLMTQSSPSRRALRIHVRCVGAVVGLGDAEREAALPGEHRRYPFLFLFFGAVMQHQHQADVVADDRVLVLQIVVQAESLRGEMLADDRHAEVRAVLAAVRLRERIPIVTGVVGEFARLREQRLPILGRQAAAIPVGARVFAAMVEEADVVVRIFERLDLALDEVVELDEVVGQVFWNVEVHVKSPMTKMDLGVRSIGTSTI